MLFLKPGILIDKLQPQALLILQVADGVYNPYPCVMTSGNDGQHRQDSLHYQGLAVDLRTRDLPGGSTGSLAHHLCKKLAAALGDNYDVILESDHLHIEFDPERLDTRRFA